jgi:hypothetical protein
MEDHIALNVEKVDDSRMSLLKLIMLLIMLVL